MKTTHRPVLRALFELCRYDLMHGLLGIADVERQLGGPPANQVAADPEVETLVCEAVVLATCLYWKPVLCLQRSICTVRLLRLHGLPARLVVGYRSAPFSSHAWVEVDNRIVNDSPAYRERLRILYTA